MSNSGDSTSTEMDKKPSTATDEDSIQVAVANQDGVHTIFKIKNTTPLEKLMKSYLQRNGLKDGAVRFMYNGMRINDTDTAKSMEMENEDVIDAMVEQTGGMY